MKLHALGLVAGLASTLAAMAPQVARADGLVFDGYVCSAALDPRGANYGTAGHIKLTASRDGDCQALTGFYVKSASGAGAGYSYTSAQLVALLDQLIKAGTEGRKVHIYYPATNDTTVQLVFFDTH